MSKVQQPGFPSFVFLLIVGVMLVLGIPADALAHEGAGVTDGFVSGFTHPLFGWDHVIAMIVRSTAGVHA